MIDDLSVVILVRCLAAVLLVLGCTTVVGACVMARASTDQQVRRRFALTIVAPLVGLAGVAAVLRGLP